MGLLLLVLMVGCGRFAFESSPDASDGQTTCTGHDEDGDGFADPCDLCPTSADPSQLNPDGDGATDECDCGFGAVDRVAVQTQGLELRIDYYLQVHTN